MKIFFHKIIMALLWLAGGVFFVCLSFYIAISFLTKSFRKLFRWKELYHFRENEFPALNVIHDSEKNILIGKLPVNKGETLTYKIPIAAKEVLLEFKLTKYPAANIEFDYCLSASDTSFRREFIYIFVNPFDSMKLSYDKVLLWYPLPEDQILKVQFTDVKTIMTEWIKTEGYLSIVQTR